MADNIVTQATTPATLPNLTRLAAILGSFAGDSDAVAGVAVLAEVSGAEGARVMTVHGPIESDIQSVPTSLTAIPTITDATAIRLDGVLVVNSSAAAITFGLTNGADQYLMPVEQVPARSSQVVPFHGMPITGLKWVAGGSGLTGKAWGRVAL